MGDPTPTYMGLRSYHRIRVSHGRARIAPESGSTPERARDRPKTNNLVLKLCAFLDASAISASNLNPGIWPSSYSFLHIYPLQSYYNTHRSFVSNFSCVKTFFLSVFCFDNWSRFLFLKTLRKMATKVTDASFCQTIGCYNKLAPQDNHSECCIASLRTIS